jgi:tetratricopeptide (TPR) repeat protein
MDQVFNPNVEEERLKERLREAYRSKDSTIKEIVKSELVQLYLQHGEYFKMNTNPDPYLAEKYLKKALDIQKDHPVVNYRYAHVLYRQEKYVDALTYFHRAIDGSVNESLNDTQMKLARMFIVNCGLFIVKEALSEMEEVEEDDILIDEGLIQKYQSEILVGNVKSLDRMYYQKMTENEKDTIISETAFQELVDSPNEKTVLLGKNNEGYFMKTFGKIYEGLDKNGFMILLTILTSREFLTNTDVIYHIDTNFNTELSEESIRQSISRLNRRISNLDLIIETKRIESELGGLKTGRRLHPSITYCILYRADDELVGRK